jgi:hypothetical protein
VSRVPRQFRRRHAAGGYESAGLNSTGACADRASQCEPRFLQEIAQSR